MEKAKSIAAILGLGITIGVVVAVLLIFVFGAKPTKIIVGNVEFEIPTPTETKPKEIEATQTSVSKVLPTSEIVVRADDIIPQLKGEDGEFQRLFNWWSEVDSSGVSGRLDPSASVPSNKCFGMAWNTTQYGPHHLIVFQKPLTVSFATGGWYTKVCIRDNIVISAEEVGKIQADWLAKRYKAGNTSWKISVIE